MYAAQRSSDRALTLTVINKTDEDLTSTLSVTGFRCPGKAKRFTYSPADLTSIARNDDLPVNRGSATATYPANSITTLVLPRG